MKDDKIMTLKDFKRAAKWKEFKEGFKSKAKAVDQWLYKHKEIVITLVPVFVGATIKIVKMVSTNKNTKEQKDLHDLYCYDKSLGHYWRLSKPLTNSQWLEIDRRKKNGERLSDILNDLRVLY